jgi:hypothetical protein
MSPLINESSYSPPPLLKNPHLQTILPSLFRKVRGVVYQRSRLNTPDNDFIDIDYCGLDRGRLAILLHGLEGNSQRAYMLGMVKALNRSGWDALAINFRGCGGEPNKLARFYHSGDTEDLKLALDHAQKTGLREKVALIGFSLGGNVVLKYLGESGAEAHPLVHRAVAISTPCDLESSSQRLASKANKIYMKRFLRMLEEKVKQKAEIKPGEIDYVDYGKIKTFQEFDDRYTAPLHGFKNAKDYWRRSSSRQFLGRVKVPTLLINARDDPFLSDECFPESEARDSRYFYLETPAHGGHVGFITFGKQGQYWHETRTVRFLNEDETA